MKKNTIDLSKRAEKVSEEMLDKVRKTVSSLSKIEMELGNLEVRKHGLLHHHAGIQDEATKLRDEMQAQYGSYDINLSDGTINYNDDGE